ncbi:MAG: extracellular solute-binding protein, partial [Firmicutes bacterium]|nr:extracellular solute-binding protein [Bacillota bacterium]
MARKDMVISVLVVTLLFSMAFVASAAPVTVKFWYSLGGDHQELILELVNRFNASQSAIFVDASFSGDYYETQQKLLAAIAAGNPPAIAQIMDCSVSMFVEYGSLDEITPELQEKLDVGDFVQTFLGNSYYQGKMWVIPFNRSTPILYVNQDRLDAAGVEIPQTWQELEEAAKKLTIRNTAGEVETFGFQTPVDIWFYEALLWSNEGEYYTEDLSATLVAAPESVEVAQFWTDLVKKGVMRQPAGKHYMAWDVTTDDFINEKAAMCFLS